MTVSEVLECSALCRLAYSFSTVPAYSIVRLFSCRELRCGRALPDNTEGHFCQARSVRASTQQAGLDSHAGMVP